MEQIVENIKKRDPERYKNAQREGEEIMSRKYDYKNNEQGRDIKGDEIRYNHLMRVMNDYGLTHQELTNEEKLLIKLFNDDK